RRHKCSNCTRSFASEGGLKRHEGTHSDKKPYLCNICFKRFRRKDECERHYLTH
ncbi:hypothetical protein K469DRAFT_473621, partial [Zopfia rhizophila CBS 207.26]